VGTTDSLEADQLAALAPGFRGASISLPFHYFFARELTCSKDLTSDAQQTQKQINGLQP
jgi:hypothetical protein